MKLDGQLTLSDYLSEESEIAEEVTTDMSCFSVFRSEEGGVRYGICTKEKCNCEYCEAYSAFYEKAEEYYTAGNQWGMSVALARNFFGLPEVPEYSVKAYR